MGRVNDIMKRAVDQEITFVPMILHNRLVKLLSEAGIKRGRSVQQLVSDAILEKAERMYEEDFPKGG